MQGKYIIIKIFLALLQPKNGLKAELFSRFSADEQTLIMTRQVIDMTEKSKKKTLRTLIIIFVVLFILSLPYLLVKLYFDVQIEMQSKECISTYGSYLDDIKDNYERFCEFSEYLIKKGACDYNYELLEGDYYDVLSLFHEPEITVEQVNGCNYVVYRMMERHYGKSFIFYVYVSDPDNFRPEQIYIPELKKEYENVWGYWLVTGGGD